MTVFPEDGDWEVVGAISFDGSRWSWRVDIIRGVWISMDGDTDWGSSRSEKRARKQLAKSTTKAHQYIEGKKLAEATREIIR